MKMLLLVCMVSLIACVSLPGSRIANHSSRPETVVLLHGLARSDKSMSKMARSLRANGYEVINVDYPSTTAPIEELAEQIFKKLDPQLKKAPKVHFVTHSMGGIILRHRLQQHPLPNMGRVVMLAPPSRGSEVTDKLGGTFLYKWINGPAGNQLGTGKNSLPLRLKNPAFELGIIAGDRSINPILSMLIPGPDDGKVALARVRPDTYTDYLQLHVTHACMMQNRRVIAQTCRFLKTGAFQKGDNA